MTAPTPFAWISCVGEKGGAETLMIECLKALDRSRFQPHVIQLRPGPLEDLLKALDVPVTVLQTHRMREVHRVAQTIFQILQVAAQKNLKLLHSNGFRAHVYGGIAAAMGGLAEVWTTHTVETPGLSTRMILGIPTDNVLANCPRTAEYFHNQGIRTDLVWPGVDVDALRSLAATCPREDLAKRYALPTDRPWIVVAARLQRFKGQHLFLEALARIPQKLPFHAIVVGGSLFGQETEYQQALRAMTVDLNLKDRVTFTGFVPDKELAGLLANADWLAHPALEEDFGLSVAEAQALGVPAIAFASVGPSAILQEDVTGWLVPVGDVDQLAARIERALTHPERRLPMGQAGAIRIAEEFSAAQHARLTESIYSRALDLRGRSC